MKTGISNTERVGMSFPQYQYIAPQVLLNAAGDDLDTFRMLSQTFLKITPPMFERLQHAMVAGDDKEIAQACHALRGSTSLIGATRLTAALQAIESAALAGTANGAPAERAGLPQLMESVMQEVLQSIFESQNNFLPAGTTA
jgi:HPt (histidine-containing phosphotransfer) domain-containing protein